MSKRLFFGVFLVIAFVFTGCDNEPLEGDFSTTPGNGSGGATSNNFFANLDGAEFVDLLLTATVLTDGTERVSFSALDANNNRITLTIPTAHPTGTYSFVESVGSDPTGVSGSYLSNAIPYVSSNGGTMTITEKTDNSITGTFSFEAVNGADSFQITNGTFSVVY